jgi:2-polyprenyl-3-methyl-5-hydroxy-6-metoxy-1,4-benzoquinol methylase
MEKGSLLYIDIIDNLIKEFVDSPIDLLDIGDGLGEYKYIESMRGSYMRTVLDVLNYCKERGWQDYSKIKVLEVGSFLGVVSISLARLGFVVTALDIPQFNDNERLKKKYAEDKVSVDAVNLHNLPLPYEIGSFDIVIMCETLEHLNFNPVEPLNEIQRVLKREGILYISVPNLACLENRIVLLRGRSIHHPIDYFFKQLDPKNNMVAGIHWREYTKAEIKELLERTGFKMVKHYFTDDLNPHTKFARIRKFLLNFIPQLRVTQIILSLKN